MENFIDFYGISVETTSDVNCHSEIALKSYSSVETLLKLN